MLQTASDDGSAAAAAFVRHDSVSGCGVLLDFLFFFASSEELELKTLRTAAASETEPTPCWLMSVLCF